MTQISDIGLQQILLNSFQQAEEGSQTRQVQLATGKVSSDFAGLGAQTTRLLSAESVFARATAFEGAASAAGSRLQIQETGLNEIASAVESLRADIVRALSTGASELLPITFSAVADRVISSLNIDVSGVFVFGGADGEQPPAALGAARDLASADLSSIFPATERTQLIVEQGLSLDGGATAAEIGADALSVLQSLLNAETTTGPLSGALTNDQQAFFRDILGQLQGVTETLTRELSVNGLAQSEAARAEERQVQRQNLAEIVAGEIENVDIAEVVTRLEQDRIAIEAAARALSTTSELSLLNFL